jgi:hypothetical protein
VQRDTDKKSPLIKKNLMDHGGWSARLTDPAIAGFCEMNTTGIRLASILVAEGAKLASSLVAKKLILANLSSLKSRGSSFARTKRASVGAVLKHLVIRRAADRWKDLRAFAMALVLRTVSQTEHPEVRIGSTVVLYRKWRRLKVRAKSLT